MKLFSKIFVLLFLLSIVYENIAAQSKEREKTIDEIITELKQESTSNPSDTSLYFLLGDAYSVKGLLDAAYGEYLKVWKMNKENVEALMKIGSIQIRRENWEDAEEKFISALNIYSDSGEKSVSRGLGYEFNLKFDIAIAEYERALVIYNDLIDIHKNLGMFAGRKEMPQDGIKHYQRIIDLKKSLADIYQTLGIIYRKRKLINASVLSLKNALEITPRVASIHYNLGLSFSLVDSLFQNGIDSYQKSIEIDSTDASVHYELGMLYGKTGKLGHQIWELQKTVKLKPDFTQARIDLAVAYFNNRQYLSSWEQVKEVEKYGSAVPPKFLSALTKVLPRPKD
ncbi:tetratricopeptide repeat protein [candidate division KSB1 bacterium]